MATERITVKSSTVFVSVGHETRVFRSVDEVPPEWRKRFERPRGGLKPQTILIADRNGREEIRRSMQGQPSAVQTRWNSASGSPGVITGSVPTAASLAAGASGAHRLLGPGHADSPSELQWNAGRIAFESVLVLTGAAAIVYAFFL
ncbi:hypothetical protein F183_A25680 [Bryobacterales bacterium F-183]|nr:hypothetical protein F183_A25680 [Bryobacterales bacterium F-183]